ncbi:MAG: hypothetical protein M0P16_08150 [Syntrophales bacterium]|nr:hypothetical protein [Syntrophales bacterium]MCK9391126.1 hypothetical protein [Syntrophales bacterium]
MWFTFYTLDNRFIVLNGFADQDIQISKAPKYAHDEKQDCKEEGRAHLLVQPIADKEPPKDQNNEGEANTAGISHLNVCFPVFLIHQRSAFYHGQEVKSTQNGRESSLSFRNLRAFINKWSNRS